MICDKCGKNEAEVFVEKIINGYKEKYNLCKDCAGSIEATLPFTINISDFLTGLKSINQQHKTLVSCKNCNMSYDQFEKLGKFGCEHCYNAFEGELPALFKRIHGSDIHVGELHSKKLKLQELKAQLSESILKEDYENAAILRDKIKEIQEGDANDIVE